MKIVQNSQNLNKTPNNINNKVEKSKINPIFFIFLISFFHVLGVLLLVAGIIIGDQFERLEFHSGIPNNPDDPDIILFSNPIDFPIYFLIVVGSTILCGMLIYWVIFLKIRKTVANEKRDNEFILDKWIKYRHIMNFEKIKPSHPLHSKKK